VRLHPARHFGQRAARRVIRPFLEAFGIARKLVARLGELGAVVDLETGDLRKLRLMLLLLVDDVPASADSPLTDAHLLIRGRTLARTLRDVLPRLRDRIGARADDVGRLRQNRLALSGSEVRCRP
jgi:hypothetical protein